MLEIHPIEGIGEITPGTDLAATIVAAAGWLRSGDVLVVTSKIVSKAEGRLLDLPPPGPERERVRAEALAAETARLVASRGQTRIVATHHGFVMAAAGIDASNVDSSQVALLPKDPDASAWALREALLDRHGLRVGVIISDTMGRPWRNGLTDVALGAAGIDPLLDHRGQVDPYGNELTLTQVALVDEVAAAAELVKGKRGRIPVAVVRGLPAEWHNDRAAGVVASLVRDPAADMFRQGSAEARADGLRAAAALPEEPRLERTLERTIEQTLEHAIERAVTVVSGAVSSVLTVQVEPPPGRLLVRCPAADPQPRALIRLGADAHRIRAALAAERLTTVVDYPAPGTVAIQVIAGPE